MQFYKAVFLILSLAMPSWVAYADGTMAPAALAEQARRSTVYLEINFINPINNNVRCQASNQGSGFVISEDGHVLTTSHVLEIPKECGEFTELELYGRIGFHLTGDRLPMRKIRSDENTDIVILKFFERDNKYIAANMCISGDLLPATELRAFGFPFGAGYSSPVLTYSNADGLRDRWIVSGDIAHGMSGGPVYDLLGRAVAITQGGAQGGPLRTDLLNQLIPIRSAIPLIQASGVQLHRCDALSPDPERVWLLTPSTISDFTADLSEGDIIHIDHARAGPGAFYVDLLFPRLQATEDESIIGVSRFDTSVAAGYDSVIVQQSGTYSAFVRCRKERVLNQTQACSTPNFTFRVALSADALNAIRHDVPDSLSCEISDAGSSLGVYELARVSGNDSRLTTEKVIYEISDTEFSDKRVRTLAIYFSRLNNKWVYRDEGSVGFLTSPGFTCNGARSVQGISIRAD